MNKQIIFAGLIFLFLYQGPAISGDKTLISWVTLKDTTVNGGSALTIQDGGQYDGIFLSGESGDHWVAGSDDIKRTENMIVTDSKSIKPKIGTINQLAIVYAGNEIRIYQNQELVSGYTAQTVDLLDNQTNFVVFGLNHWGGEDFISAEIEDARIYDRALTLD